MLTAVLALFSVAMPAEPQWIAPAPPSAPTSPEPRWVWAAAPGAPAPTAQNAPVGTVYLARSFDAAGGSAALALAADNEAAAFLNGERVLRARDWSSPSFATLSLRAGSNLVVIEARNGPGGDVNPGGAIAQITFENGSSPPIVTDAAWTGTTQPWPGFPAAPPPDGAAGAADLGPCTSPPWNVKPLAFAPAPPCPIFRRVFTLAEAPSAAAITIIGLGHYELRCNGQTVGQTVINQAWSQYNKTLYSQTFDLAPYLRHGENVLAVALGSSFWSVGPVNDGGRFSKTDAMPDFSNGWPFLLRADATITMPAGEMRIVTDDAWKWSRGPTTFSHIYAGEDFDARLEQPGWDAPGFDDAAWAAPAIAPPPAGTPTPLDGPGLEVFRVFDPVEVKTIDAEAGIYTYIFPQNCSAMPRFTLDGGRAGSRVRFRPCEYIEPDGRVKFTYTWGTGKDIWIDYTKRGGGAETHQPSFFYVGAQYVQVEGAVPEGAPNPRGLPVVKALQLAHTRAACPQVGIFESSSAVHNAADDLIDWSIRSNMSYVPTDCPHREKNGWIEQNWHMARALSYRYDVRAWLGKSLRDIRDTQLADGHVPTNCPNYLVGVPPHGYWNEAPEWGISSVLVPWHLYEWYGDRRILEANYESAKRYVAYLASTAKDGIITSNLGDWYDYGHGKGNGPSQWTPPEVSATAIWAYGVRTLANMAEALGKESEAAEFRAQFVRMAAGYRDRFYDVRSGTIKNNGSCQAGTAAALCIGLIPEADVPMAAAAIASDLEARNWQQTPGEVLHVFLIRALAEHGHSDALYRVFGREDVGSYGYLVKSGQTTLPESWDGRRGTGDSMNHFMLGHLMEWHYAYVCGIRQQAGSVGWKKVLIAPQPPPTDGPLHNITSAQAAFDSPQGRIVSRWEIQNNVFLLRCEIPLGVDAIAILPDGSRHELPIGPSSFRCEGWR